MSPKLNQPVDSLDHSDDPLLAAIYAYRLRHRSSSEDAELLTQLDELCTAIRARHPQP